MYYVRCQIELKSGHHEGVGWFELRLGHLTSIEWQAIQRYSAQ